LLEGFDSISATNIYRDNISIIYREESKLFAALYNKSKLVFRRKIELADQNAIYFISSNDNNQVVFVDKAMKVYTVDENNYMDLEFDNKVHFHHPYIFYAYEKNEIWVQSIDKPNIINRFVFVNTITAFSIVDQVYNAHDANISPESKYMELLLTYEKCHRLAKFGFGEDNCFLLRMQKPIYFIDLPNANILSFTTMKATNDKNKEEI